MCVIKSSLSMWTWVLCSYQTEENGLALFRIFSSSPPPSNRKYIEGASEIKTAVYLSSHSEIKGFLPFYGWFNLGLCDLRNQTIWQFFFSLFTAMLQNNDFLSLNLEALKIIDLIVSLKSMEEVWIKTWFLRDCEGIKLLHRCSCYLIHWCC